MAVLLREAGGVPALRSVVDAEDAAFLAQGRMPERIAEACRASGQPVPATRAEVARCILDSPALAHPRAVEDGAAVGRPAGGRGVRRRRRPPNALPCRLPYGACRMPVVAGATEAAALGNVLVQARVRGLAGDLAAMRRLLTRTQPLTRYAPRGDGARRREAEARLAAR